MNEEEPDQEESSPETKEPETKEEKEVNVTDEREFYLNEGNYRYKQLLLLAGISDLLEELNENMKKLGSLIEDSMAEDE